MQTDDDAATLVVMNAMKLVAVHLSTRAKHRAIRYQDFNAVLVVRALNHDLQWMLVKWLAGDWPCKSSTQPYYCYLPTIMLDFYVSIRFEHHLMEFINIHVAPKEGCVNDRIVAGGYGLNRLLRSAHPEQHAPWDDGDVDIFVHATDASLNEYEYVDGVLTDIADYFGSHGYDVKVDTNIDSDGLEYSEYGGSMLPLSAYPHAMPGTEFGDDELLMTINSWLEEVAPSESRFATRAASGRTVLEELQRVQTQMPHVRRPRRWTICQGGAATKRVVVSQTKQPELPPVVLNVIAMRPLPRAGTDERKLSMSDVASDFDIASCGVEGGAFHFGGDPTAVAEAAAGRRTLRLTSAAFEALMPRLLPIQHWQHPGPDSAEAERRRYHALRFSVDRQMRRIAKYLLRGFAWPEA